MKRHSTILFVLLKLCALGLFAADMCVGSVEITLRDILSALVGGDCNPITAKIIVDIRLTKAVMAILAGAALSVSGLQMQTLFRNPLAGPYVLGVSSGASLGVALFILGAPLWGLGGGVTLLVYGCCRCGVDWSCSYTCNSSFGEPSY